MNVQIPIAGITLTDGETYSGQLPVWATRPLMIRVKPDFISGNEYPVHIQVVDGGAVKKEVVFPYQEEVNVDLSFAAPLLTRADRNKSQGDPAFPQQLVNIWSPYHDRTITLPVFHCDETYWDTLGVDGALPQPPKPRIPGQTLDIYFPYRIHPLDAFPVEVEPVTGAPSSAIFPTNYVLGNTIDITYIKKLTIKNVWGSGLDQVINYEDRLMSDVVYDESLQCALRARWNMRNGQWFWAAFKDYFWSNKFTPIRGRGGVTEQAEITINLEYGEEYYNVYQELLVSSNVVFELNIPGINQYQSKRFKAEVSGDTGARWSNSTKTYRQQVRFKTTELQDNYMFPLAPDQPPTPSIAFSAQHNPWMVGASYAEGLVNSIYSNAAWEVQSTPSWVSVDSPTGNAGTTPLVITVTANTGEARTGNIVLKSKAGSTTYTIPVTQQKASISLSPSDVRVGNAYQVGYCITAVTANTDWRVDPDPQTWIDINPTQGVAGTRNIFVNIQANTGAQRTTYVTFRSKVNTSVYKTLTITQTDVPASISVTPIKVTGPKAGADSAPVICVSSDSWTVASAPSWVFIAPTSGSAGSSVVGVGFDQPNNTGAERSGQLRLENTTTHEIAICLITQEG